MKAIGKYIIVDTIKEEVKSASGMLLSGNDVKDFRYHKGKVITPGTEVSHIKEGDVIYYDKSHSFTMLIKDVPMEIIQERDVVVVED